MSDALDTAWTDLFHVGFKNREGLTCQRGVRSSIGRVQTGRSFVEDNAGSLRSFNIFRQQAARAHLVIKSVWSANIADLDACGLNSATARIHIHGQLLRLREKYSSLKNIFVILLTECNASFNSIKNFSIFTRNFFIMFVYCKLF